MTTAISDNNFDVVIVGSGLTGLIAAYNILQRDVGLSILIIEKNDMIGGRILEEGESRAFFGNYSQINMTALLNQLDIKIETGSTLNSRARNFVFLTENAGPLTETSHFVSGQVYHFLKMVDAMSKRISCKTYLFHKTNERLGEMSVGRLIKLMVHFPRARALCTSLLRACCPGIEKLGQVSALWFLIMLNGAGGLFEKLSAVLAKEKRFFVEGGFVSIVKILEKKIIDKGGIIKLSENVVKIEKTGRAVHVNTDSNRFRCDCVVIAVPPPFNVRIIPETKLPEFLLDSQNFYQVGTNVFFYAKYSEAFWTMNSSLVVGSKNSPLRMFYDASHERKNRILAGFSSSENFNDTLIALERCFRTNRVSSFESSGTSNAAPINVLRPCSIKYHLNPMHASLDKILFAASEFATCWPGTADGAVETGIKVARSILSWTRPQALAASEITATYSLRGESSTGEMLDDGIATAHAICLALNICLFFLLLDNAYRIT